MRPGAGSFSSARGSRYLPVESGGKFYMNALITLSLILLAALLLFVSVAYLVNNKPRPQKAGAPAPDAAVVARLAGKRLRTRLAFGCSALILLAHRAAMTYMILSLDFNDTNALEGFGMSWWFLDPVAGFPIVLGSLPFNMPMARLMNEYYIPLSMMIYGALIYGLWRLSRHAFAASGPKAGQGA